MSKVKNIPNWDLKDFYSSITDSKINKDKKEIDELSKKFTKKYKGEIKSPNLTVNILLKALTDYEKILQKTYMLGNFSDYLFTTNTKSDEIKNFYQESQEFSTKISSQILWFNLEWIELNDKVAKSLIKNNKLNKYKHYLNEARVFKPFTLSEKEEQIFTLKSQTSNEAFKRLYDQTESAEKFEIEIDGKKQTLNSSEIGSIMKNHQERLVREKAIKSYSETHSKNGNLYTYILNTLLLDKKINDEIRKFNYPEEATFLNYEIKPKTVEIMTKTVTKNKSIVEEFYLAKKKILKTDKLHEWDRYSNIFTMKSEKTYSWNEAKEIILSTFKEVSNEFYNIAKLFFDNNWIDAEIKSGKRSGAYCSYNIPTKHPMVFVNYSGRVEDISTLAHELGHAIHAYLGRDQKLLQFYSSTAIAEMASTFAESLVFEKLYKTTSDKKEKINLLGGKIQNNFATVFRQNDFYLFEKKIHELRRTKGELTEKELSNLYQTTLQETFGKGLILTELHKNFWMPISHFYHYNFYVFTYVLGELLALSVYAEYKKQGKDFIEKYIKSLKAAGSLNPYEITKIMGIDIEKDDFWQNGLNLIKEEVESFKSLTKQ